MVGCMHGFSRGVPGSGEDLADFNDIDQPFSSMTGMFPSPQPNSPQFPEAHVSCPNLL